MSGRRFGFDDEEYERHRPKAPMASPVANPVRPPPLPPLRREETPSAAPLPREEFPSLPPKPPTGAEKVSLWGLAEQLAELKRLWREGLIRAEQLTHALIRRSDARTRTMFCELSGDIEDLKAGQAEILLALHQRDQDREPIAAAQAAAVRAAEEARRQAAACKVEADEEITGQYRLDELAARRASKTDELVFDLAAIGAEAAKQHLGVRTERERATTTVETHGAITKINVHAEGSRTAFKTIATSFGAGGIVVVLGMALIQRGC